MKRAFFSLACIVMGALNSGCAAQGSKMDFDQMATQAVREIQKIADVAQVPCFLTITKRDYRYQYCFQDDSGSTAETVKKMRKAMEDAGFQSLSQGSQNGELDTVYRVRNLPYSVEINFTGTAFDWVMWEDKRGYLAPRSSLDDGANYALLDPTEMARQMLLELLLYAGYGLNQSHTMLGACGESTAKQGSACSSVDLTIAKAKKGLIHRFFSDEAAWFDPLDAKPTFEYRREPLLAEMLKEGSRKPGDPPSSLLVRKESEGVYFMTDRYSWPAYEFRFEPPTKAAGPLKVTATRRIAPPSSDYPVKKP